MSKHKFYINRPSSCKNEIFKIRIPVIIITKNGLNEDRYHMIAIPDMTFCLLVCLI